ncbi:hypothetical protein D3C72_2442800 [compost metagenome]
MLYRALQAQKLLEDGQANGDGFADAASISAYAKDAVDAMQANGIIQGMGDNTFNPQGLATRVQSAKVIYEVLNAFSTVKR